MLNLLCGSSMHRLYSDIQVPDGLAPSKEDGRGPYLAAVGHPPSRKIDIG